jgi:hydrogenase maturation protein HypF
MTRGVGKDRAKRLLVYGVVQGVGFRPTVYTIAKALGLKGYVRNNGSNVEVVLDEGHEDFISKLKVELPPLARLDRIDVTDFEGKWRYKDFVILKSRQGTRDAPIPPDTALCDDCLREMFDASDRRHHYPFTNCTNCGARFSVIADMPYDRPKTAMDEFKLCKECLVEYKDPLNRRFHAQTISCKKEGLNYTLHDDKGRVVRCVDPIAEFSKRIDAGDLGIVKSWGGMHITCIPERIPDMRDWYKRPSKPFAIMVRDLKAAGRYATFDDFEAGLLSSKERPIVIVKRKAGMLEEAAPGLGNIGLFLPCTGVQYLMFKDLKHDALVMTSANPAGEPMLIENDDAFGLGLDWYLLHNRRIINRVDDSVLVPFEGRKFLIRKSRGYTPLFIPINYDRTILSVGPERNVNSSLSKARRLYTSQYIGHTYKYNVMLFLDHGTRYLMRLLGIKDLDAVVMDLHPQYPTRAFARTMAEESDAPLFEVQHHFAHATSIMLDNGIEDTMACISVDGTGYGTDGKVWGGEVLVNDLEEFKRVGTLQGIPLIGGDAAIKDPRRVVFAIKERLGLGYRAVTDQEAAIFRKLMKKSIECTSLGRVLDALSCWLEVCCVRSYDGEPPMRLEPYLATGRPRFEEEFEVDTKGTDPAIIQTVPMFGRLEELLERHGRDEATKADLALSFVRALMRKMVDISVDGAEGAGSRYIGFTGGVSYNIPITRMVKEFVQEAGLELLLHDNIPNGDGGISIGQNVTIGERLKHQKD